jgi:hypothetical protein
MQLSRAYLSASTHLTGGEQRKRSCHPKVTGRHCMAIHSESSRPNQMQQVEQQNQTHPGRTTSGEPFKEQALDQQALNFSAGSSQHVELEQLHSKGPGQSSPGESRPKRSLHPQSQPMSLPQKSHAIAGSTCTPRGSQVGHPASEDTSSKSPVHRLSGGNRLGMSIQHMSPGSGLSQNIHAMAGSIDTTPGSQEGPPATEDASEDVSSLMRQTHCASEGELRVSTLAQPSIFSASGSNKCSLRQEGTNRNCT